jgi:hypothetical protein
VIEENKNNNIDSDNELDISEDEKEKVITIVKNDQRSRFDFEIEGDVIQSDE